jgi:hypothetical protein
VFGSSSTFEWPENYAAKIVWCAAKPFTVPGDRGDCGVYLGAPPRLIGRRPFQRTIISEKPEDRKMLFWIFLRRFVSGASTLALARVLAFAAIVARLASALTFTRILAFAGVLALVGVSQSTD